MEARECVVHVRDAEDGGLFLDALQHLDSVLREEWLCEGVLEQGHLPPLNPHLYISHDTGAPGLDVKMTMRAPAYLLRPQRGHKNEGIDE